MFTYNRLGRAYKELREYHLAKEAYQRAIELDPYSTIANKNLTRLSHLGETIIGWEEGIHKVEPQQFIEEVGKAGVVPLYYLAPPAVLAKIAAGDTASLKIEGPNLMVESSRGEYWGQVESKHGQHLIKLMEGGNKYSTTIVSATEETVTVIIREVYQHPSQVGRLFFLPKGAEGMRSHVSQVGDRIIRRELEYEETLPEKPGYTIIGGDGEEAELLTEESPDVDNEADEA